MPRRAAASIRLLDPDPVHGSKLVQSLTGVQIHPELVEQRSADPALLLPVHPERGAGGAMAEPEVLHDRERRYQAEILVNEAHPQGMKFTRMLSPMQNRSVDLEHPSGLGSVETGQALDQGRLAGPVLSQQAEDLA